MSRGSNGARIAILAIIIIIIIAAGHRPPPSRENIPGKKLNTRNLYYSQRRTHLRCHRVFSTVCRRFIFSYKLPLRRAARPYPPAASRTPFLVCAPRRTNKTIRAASRPTTTTGETRTSSGISPRFAYGPPDK